MTRGLARVRPAALCALLAGAAVAQQTLPADMFGSDVRALGAGPRVSGSPQGRAACDYIERRLRAMGISDILVQEFPTAYSSVAACRLTVDDSSVVEMLPLRPDGIVSPVTPPGGCCGPLRYAGADLAPSTSLANSIVVMEYDCGDAWRRAYMMGARAIVFLGDRSSTPWYPKYTIAPGNLLRFWVSPEAQARIDLRRDRPSVTIESRIPWVRSSGRNLCAIVPGTQPGFARTDGMPEAVALVVNYDSYGEVPGACPAARGAANVAAALEAAQYFAAHRPKRDLWLLFLDNKAQYHQGAYAFFDALFMEPGLGDKLNAEHASELAYVEKAREEVMAAGAQGPQIASSDIVRVLMEQAENLRNDVKQELARIRFVLGRTKSPDSTTLALRDSLAAEASRWDAALKSLSGNTLAGVDAGVVEALKGAAAHRLSLRSGELRNILGVDKQEKILRDRLGNSWLTLCVSYDFSDLGPTWGVAVGDGSEASYVYETRRATWDNPGHYGQVVRAVRDAAAMLGGVEGLDAGVLRDPTLPAQYIPGLYASAANPAGVYGIFNLSFMTYHDVRARDGHPADIIENLGAGHLQAQARAATQLLGALAGTEGLSLPRAFPNVSMSEKPKLPRWDGGRPTGYSADLMISGSLAENRPAAGAMVAVFPQPWPGAAVMNTRPVPEYKVPGFNEFPVELVDANGKYRVRGVNRDLFGGSLNPQDKVFILVAATFDSNGAVDAIVNTRSCQEAERIRLFPARGYVVSYPLYGEVRTNVDTRVLQASSNAVYRFDKSFFTYIEDFVCFYVHRFSSDNAVKVFQPFGAVFLGASREEPYGRGFPLADFVFPPAVDSISALDLWELNETRLALVRSKGVTDIDLEVLHNRARQYQDKAYEAPGVLEKQPLFARSAVLSRLVYDPVKRLMNDLIRAIVILLLLAIPFAFSLERLLICATTVYGRVAGFAVLFLATFVLLYFLHPGFSIAATPIIVFLAFAIIVLTSMVIFIMMRKFRTELMAFQGKVTSMHNAEISRMGTMLAAVSMGMSTMRRRPNRTVLTCITVVMLTFTILCFASFSSSVGVRSFYIGPPPEEAAAGFYIHMLDYSKLPRDIGALLSGREGAGGLTAGQWWKSRIRPSDRAMTVARVDDGRAGLIDAIMGFDGQEVLRWEALSELLEGDSAAQKAAALESGGVYLPLVTREQLKLRRGDSLWVNGRRVFFAGTFDASKLQAMKQLDGRSILPVNFSDESFQSASLEVKTTVGGFSGTGAAAQRDFTRLSPTQVVIASAGTVRAMGGGLHSITIYPGPSVNAQSEGRRLAEMIYQPVWARTQDGVERMVFARKAGVAGASALIIPILVGGFIIFGTLLGSITDRQKEIYTFSALGLSPGHVGFLFLAEAGVYAVIGGLGGQLLAQALALLATFLAHQGIIQQPSINFSSTNSIFSIITVMATVLLSALYPAYRASRSANPGVQRSWKMPQPQGGVLETKFPFTVSSYDITGVVSFLSEHFREHGDAGLGTFSARNVRVTRELPDRHLSLSALVYLAPFDLGISQEFSLQAAPSEIPGIDEISIRAVHKSGSLSDWKRSNKIFLRELRRQFLLWRTLSAEAIESYRLETLRTLGETDAEVEKS